MSVIEFPCAASRHRVGIAAERANAVSEDGRASLAAAAALAPNDPVFAAIDRYMEAEAECTRSFGQEPPSSSSAAHKAWKIKNAPIVDAYNSARDAFLQTMPKTRIGAAALIGFVIDDSDGELGDEDAMMVLTTIRDALPNLD